MTCSARLPVYTLIIGVFIPNRAVGGLPVGLQGLVLFGLYVAGIVGTLIVAFVLRRSVTKGSAAGLMMEMPRYQWQRLRDAATKIGRASGRVRVCRSLYRSVVAVTVKKKKNKYKQTTE